MRRAVPPVLVPGRHPEPRRARDAGLDPRGRRARLRARARLRRRARQPRPARRLRDRRRRGRDRPAGRELALEQVPQPGARRRGAADPAPQRLQDRQPDGAQPDPARRARRADDAATATGRGSSRATSPRRCTRRWPRRSTRSSPRSAASRTTRASAARRAPALADDRAAHAEGLDRAARGRRLPVEGTSARTRCRWPSSPRTRSTCASSRRGCAPTAPRSSSTSTAARGLRSSRSRPRASAGWAPTRTPTAACCCATCGCPTSATTPSTCRRPATRSSEATRVLGGWLRDVAARQPETVPRLRARRDRLEPARRRRRGDRPRLDGRDRCPPTTTSRPTAA